MITVKSVVVGCVPVYSWLDLGSPANQLIIVDFPVDQGPRNKTIGLADKTASKQYSSYNYINKLEIAMHVLFGSKWDFIVSAQYIS